MPTSIKSYKTYWVHTVKQNVNSSISIYKAGCGYMHADAITSTL